MVYWLITGGSIVLLLITILGLVDLYRHRATMEGWQVLIWTVLIVFIPLVGLIGYLFWRISRSEAMQDALSVPREQTRSDQRPPFDPGHR
jgi:Phospholipase_D-nuclease N-terminal